MVQTNSAFENLKNPQDCQKKWCSTEMKIYNGGKMMGTKHAGSYIHYVNILCMFVLLYRM